MGTGRIQRKRGGRPALRPEERRTSKIDLHLSPSERAEIVRLAEADDTDLPTFIRDAALNRPLRPRPAAPTPELIALARALTAVAWDLRELCAAIAAGRLLGAPTDLITRLHRIAHEAGVLLLGGKPRAR